MICGTGAVVAYVHGHARETGWVVAHFRRPSAPDEGQLGLALPAPAPDPDAPSRAGAARDGGADRGVAESASDETGGRGPAHPPTLDRGADRGRPAELRVLPTPAFSSRASPR